MARTIRTPGAVSTEPEAPVVLPPEPEAGADELPNAIDIDAKAIRGPVLTAQGWVVPDESGRDPKGPR